MRGYALRRLFARLR
ncbi:hypothetical protein [Octadecabacter arcticus]